MVIRDSLRLPVNQGRVGLVVSRLATNLRLPGQGLQKRGVHRAPMRDRAQRLRIDDAQPVCASRLTSHVGVSPHYCGRRTRLAMTPKSWSRNETAIADDATTLRLLTAADRARADTVARPPSRGRPRPRPGPRRHPGITQGRAGGPCRAPGSTLAPASGGHAGRRPSMPGPRSTTSPPQPSREAGTQTSLGRPQPSCGFRA